MEFLFDIRKSVAAAGYLCKKGGGEIEMREMLKMLYVADKTALLTWERPITGDKFFSLPQGPVVSRIYDLVRYRVSGSDMDKWKAVFAPRHGNAIRFRAGAEVDLNPLSEREEKALDEAFDMIRAMIQKEGAGFIDALHKILPEWTNPNGSSILIEPDQLLRIAGVDEDSIRAIDFAISGVNSAKMALQAG